MRKYSVFAATLIFILSTPSYVLAGSIVAWGSNEYGNLDVPIGDYTAVASSHYHSLALNSDGSIVGWGSNEHGAIDVPIGNDFIAVSAGYHSSVALRADGSLEAWGWNSYGETDTPSDNDYIIAVRVNLYKIA